MRWGLGALAALATLSGAQAAAPESADGAARYAGYYFAAPSIVVKLEARDGALVAHTAGQPDATYTAEGGGKFFASAANTRLVFQTGADGLVTGALVTQGSGPSIPARRITEAEADRLAHPAVDHTLAAYASMKDSPHLPDGRVIHMVCMGQGSPVVVLTAGAGNWGIVWNKVQPAVAEKTRVCAWDRAGFGLSELSPKPQTVDNTTTDLEAALKAGKINGPYVVVGHSLGGLESLLLKDRQPGKVVGMVLVDSTVPAKPGAPLPDVRTLPEPPSVVFFRKCAAALRAGTVRAGRPDPDGCLRGETFSPDYPPELRAALDKHPADLPPETVAKGMDFLADWASQQWLIQDLAIAAKPDRNYGNMPLIVLTAGELPPPPPGQPKIPDAQLRSVLDQHRRDHDEMAALSTRGVNRVVDGSSHYIQQIKPQVVIDSIDEVVDEARADMGKSPKTAVAAPASIPAARAAEPAGAGGLARYAGWYMAGPGVVVQIEARDGYLLALSAGRPDTRYTPEGDGKFFASAIDAHVAFQTGPDGEVTGALVTQGAQPAVAARRLSAAEADRLAKPATGDFDKAAKQETVAQIGAMLTDRYVFPERAVQAKAKIDAALAAGDYESISDPGVFAQRLTTDLQSVTHDKHMRVNVMLGPPPAGAQQAPPPPMNGGFARVDILKGNIGYIRLLGFPPPKVFNPVADEALRDLAGTDALIIDMRDNGGGSAESDSYFGSFFFDPAKPVALNSIVNRTPSTNTFTTTEFWTKPVASPYVNKPVYILTSKRTFSGGEAFIYDLQVQKRVSIFGETTGGGANPGGVFPVGGRFGIFVPMGRAENPATKTNWEGVGVAPDHPMDAKLAFQAAMSDAVTQLLKKKANDAALTAVRADLAQQTEPAPFVQTALLKFRTTPSPGAEAALRRQIEGLQKSEPDYAGLSEGLANVTRQQASSLEQTMARLGALKSITFNGVGPSGGDLYDVAFEHGQTEWQVSPLTPDGKIDGLGFRETTPAAAK